MITLTQVEQTGTDTYQVILDVHGEERSYEWDVVHTDINGTPIRIVSEPRQAILDFDEYADEGAVGGCFIFRCVCFVLRRLDSGIPVALPMVIDPEDWTIEKWRARQSRDPGP